MSLPPASDRKEKNLALLRQHDLQLVAQHWETVTSDYDHQKNRQSSVWCWSHARHHSDTIIRGRDPEIAVPRPPQLRKIILTFFGIRPAIPKTQLFYGYQPCHRKIVKVQCKDSASCGILPVRPAGDDKSGDRNAGKPGSFTRSNFLG